MSEENKDELMKWHKKMAIDMFNKTWDLLDKKDRTLEEDELMVHQTHASRCHWNIIGEEIHFQRGDWQVSRVYSVLKRPKQALHYAKLCLKRTLDNDFQGFDRAYAYEAVARASAIAGNEDDYKANLKLAKEAAEKIDKKEDRDYFYQDLESGEWGVMK
ncbi:MAG: hypothetical protein ACXAEU_25735 [Candidatus Hodarchaeales archaeon]|jgi:hypothetical protein